MRFDWKWTRLLCICCATLSSALTVRAELAKEQVASGLSPKIGPTFMVDDADAVAPANEPMRTAQGAPFCPANPAQGDCCDPNGLAGPGCSIPACCEAVCATDSFCCDGLWDPSCANTASSTFAGICCDTCPTSCNGDQCCVTQNFVKQGNFNVVSCAAAVGAGAASTDQAHARCFNLATEGVPSNADLIIDSAKFGVRRMDVDVPIAADCGHFCDVPASVNLYVVGACAVVTPGVDIIPFGSAQLIGSVATSFSVEDRRRIVTVAFPGGVLVPAGSVLLAEVELTDDGTEGPNCWDVRPMASNTAPEQCAQSYLRAADCGVADWMLMHDVLPAAANRGLLLELSGHLAGGTPVVCGDSLIGGCEDCDDGNTTCGDGCDSNCQTENAICGDGVAACTEACDNTPASPFTGEIDCSATCQYMPVCGNDIVDAGEECDGCHNECVSGVCNPTCICVAPVCGDGVVNQASEECDGADVGSCGGSDLCLSDCTCLDSQDECQANSTLGGNDCCINRSDITDGITPFSTVGANTDGYASPAGLCNDGGFTQTVNDIWFNYVASCTGTLTVTTCSDIGGLSTYDSDIVLYDGCDLCPPDLDGGEVIGCNDDDPNHPCGTAVPFSSTATASVCQGQCVKIRVGGFGFAADEGTGNLNIVCEGGGCTPTGAANDCCIDSLPIDNGDTPVNTTGANTDGPPNPAGQCNDFGSTQTYHDLWFDYIAGCTETVTVSTCEDTGGSAAYDTDLVVYDGCDCCELNFLACNDDDGNNPCGNNLFHSTVSFDAIAGNCYKVRVGGWGPFDEGAAVVNISKGGCQDAGDCDDGDACTTDSCDGCACSNTPVECDDQDPCTLDDCVDGVCVFTPADCDDGDPCTTDECIGEEIASNGVCLFATDPTGCEDISCSAGGGHCRLFNGFCECRRFQCHFESFHCDDGFHCEGGACVSDAVEYALDIREKKCPNKLKCNSNGTIKAYIAGDADSDVSLIDLDSIRICPCGSDDCILPDKPPRIKDKVGPHQTACGDCSCKKLKKDYIDDVEIKFKHLCDVIDPNLPEGSLVNWEVRFELIDGTDGTAHDCTIIDRPGSGQP